MAKQKAIVRSVRLDQELQHKIERAMKARGFSSYAHSSGAPWNVS
jgi:hypothetical protein